MYRQTSTALHEVESFDLMTSPKNALRKLWFQTNQAVKAHPSDPLLIVALKTLTDALIARSVKKK